MLCVLAAVVAAFVPAPHMPATHHPSLATPPSPADVAAVRSAAAAPRMVAPGANDRFIEALRALNEAQLHSRSIKCPFWRRRAAESLEPLLAIARFVAARHKSLDLLPPELLPARPSGPKVVGLSLDAAMHAVRADVEQRQYYVTGQMNASVYSETCYFDGPDPDMPVRSLVRYRDALHGLFDPELSRFDLVAIVPRGPNAFAAYWRLEGALQLPWRPTIKPFTGAPPPAPTPPLPHHYPTTTPPLPPHFSSTPP